MQGVIGQQCQRTAPRRAQRQHRHVGISRARRPIQRRARHARIHLDAIDAAERVGRNCALLHEPATVEHVARQLRHAPAGSRRCEARECLGDRLGNLPRDRRGELGIDRDIVQHHRRRRRVRVSRRDQDPVRAQAGRGRCASFRLVAHFPRQDAHVHNDKRHARRPVVERQAPNRERVMRRARLPIGETAHHRHRETRRRDVDHRSPGAQPACRRRPRRRTAPRRRRGGKRRTPQRATRREQRDAVSVDQAANGRDGARGHDELHGSGMRLACQPRSKHARRVFFLSSRREIPGSEMKRRVAGSRCGGACAKRLCSGRRSPRRRVLRRARCIVMDQACITVPSMLNI